MEGAAAAGGSGLRPARRPACSGRRSRIAPARSSPRSAAASGRSCTRPRNVASGPAPRASTWPADSLGADSSGLRGLCTREKWKRPIQTRTRVFAAARFPYASEWDLNAHQSTGPCGPVSEEDGLGRERWSPSPAMAREGPANTEEARPRPTGTPAQKSRQAVGGVTVWGREGATSGCAFLSGVMNVLESDRGDSTQHPPLSSVSLSSLLPVVNRGLEILRGKFQK